MFFVNSSVRCAFHNQGKKLYCAVDVFIYYMFFMFIEVELEKIIFGEYFFHILDPFFLVGFCIYFYICAEACDYYNNVNLPKD
jgi:hypothetical protein